MNAPRNQDLIEPMSAAGELQAVLRRARNAEGRKRLIMAAWEAGAIDDVQCQLLIEAHGLETA